MKAMRWTIQPQFNSGKSLAFVKRLAWAGLVIVGSIALAVVPGNPRAAQAHRAGTQQVRVITGLQLSHPFGVAFDPGRHVMYVADSLHNRVLETAESGAILHQWHGWGRDTFSQPGAIAMGRNGTWYVVDYGANRIDRFAANGRPLQQWGSSGPKPGTFAAAQDLATDGAGNVYVADAANFRVQKFSSDGRFLSAWSTRTSPQESSLVPMGIGAGPNGDVYVAEVAATVDHFGNMVEASPPLHCIQRFSAQGVPITRWGTRGSLPAQFREPRGVVVDRSGQVYVADFGNNRIEQFSVNGSFERAIGPDMQEGLRLHGPIALTLDGASGILVADWFNSRIDRLSASGAIVKVWR
jgi:tripartite motif-containing protein 71